MWVWVWLGGRVVGWHAQSVIMKIGKASVYVGFGVSLSHPLRKRRGCHTAVKSLSLCGTHLDIATREHAGMRSESEELVSYCFVFLHVLRVTLTVIHMYEQTGKT